jgi:hypothetical protein
MKRRGIRHDRRTGDTKSHRGTAEPATAYSRALLFWENFICIKTIFIDFVLCSLLP